MLAKQGAARYEIDDWAIVEVRSSTSRQARACTVQPNPTSAANGDESPCGEVRPRSPRLLCAVRVQKRSASAFRKCLPSTARCEQTLAVRLLGERAFPALNGFEGIPVFQVLGHLGGRSFGSDNNGAAPSRALAPEESFAATTSRSLSYSPYICFFSSNLAHSTRNRQSSRITRKLLKTITGASLHPERPGARIFVSETQSRRLRNALFSVSTASTIASKIPAVLGKMSLISPEASCCA